MIIDVDESIVREKLERYGKEVMVEYGISDMILMLDSMKKKRILSDTDEFLKEVALMYYMLSLFKQSLCIRDEDINEVIKNERGI